MRWSPALRLLYQMLTCDLAKKGKISLVLWVCSKDICDPCGLCDPNGYCTLYDNEPKCKWPHGFGYVIPGNGSTGCV